MKLSRTVLAAWLFSLFIATSMLYLFKLHLASSIIYLLSPLAAVFSGIYATHAFGIKSHTGKVFGLLTLGLIGFFAGEVLFTCYQYVFHTDPFPSLADVFYVAAYPVMFLGFIKATFNHRVKWHNFSKVYLLFILLFLASLAALVAYFGIYLAYAPGDPALTNIMSIAYGIGDLILIVPSLFLLKIIMDYRGGKLFNSWVLMLMALMLMLAGDLLFAIYRDSYNAQIFPYTLIDLTYVANYLLFAFSFFYTASTIKEINLRLKK